MSGPLPGCQGRPTPRGEGRPQCRPAEPPPRFSSGRSGHRCGATRRDRGTAPASHPTGACGCCRTGACGLWCSRLSGCPPSTTARRHRSDSAALDVGRKDALGDADVPAEPDELDAPFLDETAGKRSVVPSCSATSGMVRYRPATGPPPFMTCRVAVRSAPPAATAGSPGVRTTMIGGPKSEPSAMGEVAQHDGRSG